MSQPVVGAVVQALLLATVPLPHTPVLGAALPTGPFQVNLQWSTEGNWGGTGPGTGRNWGKLAGFPFIIRSSKSSFRRCAFCTHSPKARRSQEELGGARRSQEEPGRTRRSQEWPGGARKSQEEPGVARKTQGQEEPRVARKTQGQEEPRGARRSQELF
jgi:hypothetical protein